MDMPTPHVSVFLITNSVHSVCHLILSFPAAILSSAGTRWRRVPVEYASTSEDEYGSNRHISKKGHTQPFLPPRVAQLGGSAPATPNLAGPPSLKQHSREQDEYVRDWTAHSEEIARYVSERFSNTCMLTELKYTSSAVITLTCCFTLGN